MAEAKPIEQDIIVSTILTCSLCHEIFDNPKTLSCGHTFCTKCTETSMKEGKEVEAERLECPLCKSIVDSGSFIERETLNRFLELYRKKISNIVNCDTCDNPATASLRCVDCKINLCEACQRIHQRTPSSRDHQYVPSDKIPSFVVDDPEYCKEHKGQVIEYYCKSCGVSTCVKCNLTVHRNHIEHEILTVEDALKNLVPIVQGHINTIMTNIDETKFEAAYFEVKLAETTQLYDKTAEECEKTFEEIHRKLDAQKSKILSELNDEKALNVGKIQSALGKTNLSVTKKQQNLDIAEAALNNTRGSSLLLLLEKELLSKMKYEQSHLIAKQQVKIHKPGDINDSCISDEEIEKLGVTEYLPLTISSQQKPWAIRNVKFAFNNILTKCQLQNEIRLELQTDKPSFIDMSLVDNNMWVPVSWLNTVYIYTLPGLIKQNSISIRQITSPYQVHQLNNMEVLVAAANGVHLVGTDGQYLYKVFDDCPEYITSNGTIVATTTRYQDKKSVHLLKRIQNKWKRGSVVCSFNWSYILTFSIVSDILYVCVNNQNNPEVHQYKTTGELLVKYALNGCAHLQGNIVPNCGILGVDVNGSILVLNDCNFSLHIMDNTGHVKCFKMEEVDRPMDVLVVGNKIYVCHFDEKRGHVISRFDFRL